MPNFPIVDTHLHLWDTEQFHYAWLQNFPTINRPLLLPDFNAACATVAVDTMVFVQCDTHFSQGMDETRWVASLASEDKRIQGIVAFAPLEQGHEVRSYLEELCRIPLVKGVRRLIQSEDLEFCLSPDFLQGLQLLPEFDLSFDICIYHPQMANIIKMVQKCPQVRFMLDHFGKPDIKNQLLEPWKTEIRELAAFPNVYCKVSGLVTEADHQNWTKEDLQPYIAHVIECFGWERVVYGSDWPVSKLATEYPDWVEALEWTVQGCTESQRRKLFRENALRFYRLNTSTPSN